ncbi:hypothetical protein L1987_85946 [Smallanthus sonchifolius]|uniref:Uncharacterized protein n=1 Tax=Smallanthus sonchifolius TaxID=185202 RepID=A0ACB8Y249_9ASTR|nr:hypothetical protein L1987_85946 [Smallanthus sonchifolius]
MCTAAAGRTEDCSRVVQMAVTGLGWFGEGKGGLWWFRETVIAALETRQRWCAAGRGRGRAGRGAMARSGDRRWDRSARSKGEHETLASSRDRGGILSVKRKCELVASGWQLVTAGIRDDINF